MHVLAKKRKEKNNNKQTQAKAKATHTWVTIRQNYLEVGREEISGLSQNYLKQAVNKLQALVKI